MNVTGAAAVCCLLPDCVPTAARVIAWEPVKIFQAYMEYSIARNRLQHKVKL
jgi:hypothetical protein